MWFQCPWEISSQNFFPLPLQNLSSFTPGLLQLQKTYCYLEAKDLEILSPEAECEEFFQY